MKKYQHIKYALKFIRYRVFAKHKKGHGIHSPFLFNLISNVFVNKKSDDELKKVNNIYDDYRKTKKQITYLDLGAGSSFTDKKPRSIKEIIKISSVPKKYGTLLYKLVQYYKSVNILELGTSIGISTAFLAQANPDSMLTSIEASSQKIKIAEEIATKLNQSTKFVIGDFDDQLENVIKTYDKLDFVFFDGNHRKESTLKYFNVCLKKAYNESVFVFDDIHWSLEMEEAWKEIRESKYVSLSIDLFRLGLIFFKKELSKEHYTIKF